MECPAQVADLEVRDDTALTPALVRANLNEASFTKLYVDGEKITEHELHKAFDALLDAHHRHTTTPTHVPPDQPTAKSVGALTDSAADNRDNSTASNPPTLPVGSWSNADMVDPIGIESIDSPQAADARKLR